MIEFAAGLITGSVAALVIMFRKSAPVPKLKPAEQQRFRYVWRLLCATMRENGHCLSSGCGKVELSCWVLASTGAQVHPWELRAVLKEAERRGWVKRSRSASGHSRYSLLGVKWGCPECGLRTSDVSEHLRFKHSNAAATADLAIETERLSEEAHQEAARSIE